MADHPEPLLSASESGHARMRFKDLFLTHVSHGLPWALLLTLLTIVLHHLHWLEDFDGRSMRTVSEAAGYKKFVGQTFEVVDDPKQRILVLEVSTRMRARVFETLSSKLANDDDIDRVGGVMPVDRIQLAKLIENVASRLEEPTGSALKPIRPGVVAIDVDVVPVGAIQADGDAGNDRLGSFEIMAAVNRLRNSAHVILINLSRPDLNERIKRNKFLVDLGCTGLPSTLRGASHDSKGQIRNIAAEPSHGLYIASPSLFYERFGYPLNFPSEPLKSNNDGKDGVFPSVANLIHLRQELDRELSSPASDDKRVLALTRVCREAAQSTSGESNGAEKSKRLREGLLLEDAIANYLPAECADKSSKDSDCIRYGVDDLYEHDFYNWRLINTDFFRRSEIDCKNYETRTDRNLCEPQIPDEIFSASVVIIGVNGGDRHDKFDTPLTGRDSVGGATVHAVGALSQRDRLKLNGEHYGWSILVDILVGLSFVLLWSAIASGIQFSTQRYFRRLAGLVLALIPLSLVAALGTLTIYVISPGFLNCDVWINPLYVLLGLCIHAYSEAWNFHADHSPHLHWPDFTMGSREAMIAVQVALHAMSEKDGRSTVPHRWIDFYDRIALPLIVVVVYAGALSIVIFRHPHEYGWLAALVCGAVLLVSFLYENRHRH